MCRTGCRCSHQALVYSPGCLFHWHKNADALFLLSVLELIDIWGYFNTSIGDRRRQLACCRRAHARHRGEAPVWCGRHVVGTCVAGVHTMDADVYGTCARTTWCPLSLLSLSIALSLSLV